MTVFPSTTSNLLQSHAAPAFKVRLPLLLLPKRPEERANQRKGNGKTKEKDIPGRGARPLLPLHFLRFRRPHPSPPHLPVVKGGSPPSAPPSYVEGRNCNVDTNTGEDFSFLFPICIWAALVLLFLGKTGSRSRHQELRFDRIDEPLDRWIQFPSSSSPITVQK